MAAQISTLLDIGRCTFDYIENRGKRYRIEGYIDGFCPTDECNAVCCRVDTLQGRVGEGPRAVQGQPADHSLVPTNEFPERRGIP